MIKYNCGVKSQTDSMMVSKINVDGAKGLEFESVTADESIVIVLDCNQVEHLAKALTEWVKKHGGLMAPSNITVTDGGL